MIHVEYNALEVYTNYWWEFHLYVTLCVLRTGVSTSVKWLYVVDG
jgi:hypothetical protein